MKKFLLNSFRSLSNFAIICLGIFFTGLALSKGALWAGHQPGAGYPFPDFEGLFVLIFVLILAPLVALAITYLCHRSKTWAFMPYSAVLLAIGPLIGVTIGITRQVNENRERQARKLMSSESRRYYNLFGEQVRKDPEIIFQENWFDRTAHNSKDPSERGREYARYLILIHSFQPKHQIVYYTEDQLRKVCEHNWKYDYYVAIHPSCPEDLMIYLYKKAAEIPDSYVMEEISKNPSAPASLVEQHKRLKEEEMARSGFKSA